MRLTAQEQATCLALVHAHVHGNIEYTSLVRPHLRRTRVPGGVTTTHFVSGHLRRQPMYSRLLGALKCTAKLYELA